MKQLILAGLALSVSIAAQANSFDITPQELVIKAIETGDQTYLEQATTRCTGLLAVTADMTMKLQGDTFDEMDEVMENLMVVTVYLRTYELGMSVDTISDDIVDIGMIYGQEMAENMEKTGNLLGVDGKLSAEIDSCFTLSEGLSQNFIGQSI